MTEIIHMEHSDPVLDVSRKLSKLADTILEIPREIKFAAREMDWTGSSKDGFLQDLDAWEKQMGSLFARYAEIGYALMKEGEEWEAAANAFGWGSQGYTPFLVGSGDGTAVDWDDVDQGGLGTCYLMASLISLAQKHPELIEQMIHDNGDGTCTVTFHEKKCLTVVGPCNYVEVNITVDMDFPPGPYDGSAYGEFGDASLGHKQGSKEAWAMIIERAYAKWKGGYSEINGGWPSEALPALTGTDSNIYSPSELGINELYESFQRGDAVTAVSWTGDPDISDNLLEYQNGTICPNHVYAITNVDPVTNKVTLINPWNDGCGPIELSYEDYQRLFEQTVTSPVPE